MNSTLPAAGSARAARPARVAAVIVVLAGVSAALHVGKLPPALPLLREAFALSLVEAGFLLSLVQLAGMSLGVAVGLLADDIGLRRSMLIGLGTLCCASLAGGLAGSAAMLLLLRAAEGFGLLLTATPAPGLIRRLLAGRGTDAMLGLWSAYMPLGVAAALLAGPWLQDAIGWRGWWWLAGALSLLAAAALLRLVPRDPPQGHAHVAAAGAWKARLQRTLGSGGPWLLALAFAVYSSQWLAVVGFLPSIYAQAGIGARSGGALTALVAAANIIGNIGAGRLLQRGVPARRLLMSGYAAMALGAAAAFAPALDGGALARFAAVLAFSLCGGMVPATLFALSLRLAPDAYTVSTTVGWMQQCSSAGQLLGPPLVAWVAHRAGGWQWTWAVTGACSLAGMLLAARIAALLRQREEALLDG